MKNEIKNCLLPGLPAYEGGRMSDEMYNAGEGLHVVFNDGRTFRYPADGSWTPWLLDQMAYAGHCGYVFDEPIEGAPFGPVSCTNGHSSFCVSLRDNVFSMTQTRTLFTERDQPALLRAVTETDCSAFVLYLDRLKAIGFSIVWENRIEDNRFYSLRRNERHIYASFFERERVARFVEDNISAPIETFGGGEAIPGERMRLCQFGLYYNFKPLSANCGMLYIVKLPDNSLFLVDGGMIDQATQPACAEMLRVMRVLSQTKAPEKIRIAGWFCTHAHDDHTDVFAKLLRLQHDQLEVERVIFNFPANSEWEPLLLPACVLFERLHQYCPNAKYLKCHTGQSWALAGVRFEVLKTHEDAVRVTGREKPAAPGEDYDFNDSSTVLKITYGDASFLILGDINNPSEAQLLRVYSEKTLKSTAMQAAHHLINNLPRLYPAVAPEIAFVPQCVTEANEKNTHYQTLLKTVPAQNIYFASCATDIFEADSGHFRLVKRYPIEGYLYDGSPL